MKLPVWILKQEKLNNLTNCEMNMYLWLLERQNDMGLVRGVRVSDFKDIMSKQSFYNAINGLKDKELINFLHHKNFNDYDVNLMLQNEESHKESEKFDEKYINLNKKIFQCSEFKKMSSREKAMMLLLYYRTSVKINANGSILTHSVVVILRIRNLQRTMTILSLQTVVVMLAVREQLMEAVLQRK